MSRVVQVLSVVIASINSFLSTGSSDHQPSVAVATQPCTRTHPYIDSRHSMNPSKQVLNTYLLNIKRTIVSCYIMCYEIQVYLKQMALRSYYTLRHVDHVGFRGDPVSYVQAVH